MRYTDDGFYTYIPLCMKSSWEERNIIPAATIEVVVARADKARREISILAWKLILATALIMLIAVMVAVVCLWNATKDEQVNWPFIGLTALVAAIFVFSPSVVFRKYCIWNAPLAKELDTAEVLLDKFRITVSTIDPDNNGEVRPQMLRREEVCKLISELRDRATRAESTFENVRRDQRRDRQSVLMAGAEANECQDRYERVRAAAAEVGIEVPDKQPANCAV